MSVDASCFDIVIAGGGMTGCVLAIAIAAQNRQYKIALIESHVHGSVSPAFDGRALALSDGTLQAFEQFKLKSVVQPYLHPIRNIHVSEKGHAARVHISANEYGLQQLGAVMELASAGFQLQKQLALFPNITLFCPDKIASFEQQNGFVDIRLDSCKTLHTKLLVGAEGAYSSLQSVLGLPSETIDFKQTAMIATVYTEQTGRCIAWERFSQNGPLALLPLGENRYSLVWCHHPDSSVQMQMLDDQKLICELQNYFGSFAGRFIKIEGKAFYPLKLQNLLQTTHHRIVLLGNAAHLLHPVAGQGFNLAMRDIITLASLCKTATDPGTYDVLKRYRQMREQDQARTVWMTSSLASLFTGNNPLLLISRQLGLFCMNNIPQLKARLVRQALGHTV